MALHEIRIDSSKPLADEPTAGHNRWHPEIAPILECAPGDEVILETRDAFDGQFSPGVTLDVVASPDLGVVHPLTGPVAVSGAERGDILEVQVLDIRSADYGYTVQVPGFGFLRDLFPEPFMVQWSLEDGYGESEQLPGIRIPGAPFLGTIGVAPDHQLMTEVVQREARCLEQGGFVLEPSPEGAIPSEGNVPVEGLRTIPPREIGGNIDIKQTTVGTSLYIPVFADGALLSVGDAHFAQGDCETCGTAIEIRASVRTRLQLHKQRARSQTNPMLRFERAALATPKTQPDRREGFFATIGLPIADDGENRSEDLTLAARNALLNMIDYLCEERGFTRQQAYAICSVAVDLKVSELVDVPNVIVSAFLPLNIFVE